MTASKVTYHLNDDLGSLECWLFNRRGGDLIDLSSYTLVLKVGIPGEAALLTKSTGLGGAAGSGDGSADDDVPNFTADWDEGEIATIGTPGNYVCQIDATTGGKSRSWRFPFDVGPVIS